MRKFVLLLALASAPILGLANSEKEIAGAREYTINTATKNLCIKHWSEPEKAAALAPFASISEMCSCIQDELRYTLSDDLAVTYFKGQLEVVIGQYGKLLPAGEGQKAATNVASLYNAADDGCRQKFIRRSQGR